MEEANMPEEMIVLILSWLPVKSLIRFTCVSKRFHSLILPDPKFAQSQFQAARDRKTLTQRLLCSSSFRMTDLGVVSLDLESPLAVRKLELPFRPASGVAKPLGSCNGIVFLSFDDRVFYLWNPSTGFFKKLPDPGFPPYENELVAFGIGYLPATDEYKVFTVFVDRFDETTYEGAIYSSRSHAWTTVEDHHNVFSLFACQGILSNEALHWLDYRSGDWRDGHNTILAFDLAQGEGHKFRTMQMPRGFNDDGGGYYINRLGVSDGGRLSFARSMSFSPYWIHVWSMKEYDVRDSWTKLYSFKFSDPPKEHWFFTRFLLLEAGLVACILTLHDVSKIGLVMNLHKEEDNCSLHMTEADWFTMIHYEESLLRIED